MSSLPYIEFSNIFNPNDFTEIDSSLNLAEADARYFKIAGGFVSGYTTFLSSIDVIGTLTINGSPIDLSFITGITAGTAFASKALVVDASLNITGINSLSATSLIINGTSISSTDLAYLSGITPGTASASKALVVNSSRNIVNINSLTATTLVGTLSTAAQPAITSVGTLTSLTMGGNIAGVTTLVMSDKLTSGLHVLNSGSEVFTPGGGVSGTYTNNIRFVGGRGLGLYWDTSTSDLLFQWGGGGLYSVGAKIGHNGVAFCLVNNMAIGSMTPNASYKLEVTGAVNITTNLFIAAENIGTKLTLITNGTAAASKALILDASRNIVNINSLTATTLVGTIGTAAQTSITSLGTLTSLSISGNLTMGSTTITESEIGVLYGVTPGTASASKALIVDSSRDIVNINSLSTTSLIVNGVSIASSDLAYLSGISPGTVTASKAVVVDGNKDISSFRNVFATRFCTNTSYSSFPIDLGNAAGDRLLAVFDNGSDFYGLGANGSRLQLHSASGAGIRMYTGSSVGATGTQIFDINSAGLITADSITLDTALTVPLANIRDNAQASGTRTEFLGIGRSSSGSDQGAWAFMNYYQTATQGDSNYFTFGPRLKTGLTTGWGMVMTQNGNVSFQDKNANGGAGGFKIQANIVGTVDIQGGITRTVGAGNGELRANATPAVYNAGTVSTRIGLWVENAIWCGDKVYVSSDKRLKRDIKPIPLDEAKKLLNVDAVSYRWKKDKFDDFVPSIGLIAQDVIDNGLDKLVSYCPNDDKENFPLGYNYGIEYSRVPIYLLELIKDLYKQLDELKRNASSL